MANPTRLVGSTLWSANCVVLYTDDNPEDLKKILEELTSAIFSQTIGDTTLIYVKLVNSPKDAELTSGEFAQLLERSQEIVINKNNLEETLRKHCERKR